MIVWPDNCKHLIKASKLQKELENLYLKLDVQKTKLNNYN